jgi:hypothetical protein
VVGGVDGWRGIGRDEMMLDGLREFVGKFESGLGEKRVEVVELEGMCHVSVNIEPMFGYERGEMGGWWRVVVSMERDVGLLN